MWIKYTLSIAVNSLALLTDVIYAESSSQAQKLELDFFFPQTENLPKAALSGWEN